MSKQCKICGRDFSWQDFGSTRKYEKMVICPDCEYDEETQIETEIETMTGVTTFIVNVVDVDDQQIEKLINIGFGWTHAVSPMEVQYELVSRLRESSENRLSYEVDFNEMDIYKQLINEKILFQSSAYNGQFIIIYDGNETITIGVNFGNLIVNKDFKEIENKLYFEKLFQNPMRKISTNEFIHNGFFKN
jgi:hypothetical protein